MLTDLEVPFIRRVEQIAYAFVVDFQVRHLDGAAKLLIALDFVDALEHGLTDPRDHTVLLAITHHRI